MVHSHDKWSVSIKTILGCVTCIPGESSDDDLYIVQNCISELNHYGAWEAECVALPHRVLTGVLGMRTDELPRTGQIVEVTIVDTDDGANVIYLSL